MSLLFYKRPNYVDKKSAPMGASEYRIYLEKSRAAIPTELCFENVIANRAMPVSMSVFKIAFGVDVGSLVRSTTSWATCSMLPTMQKISSSTCGSKIIPNASIWRPKRIKLFRHCGMKTWSLLPWVVIQNIRSENCWRRPNTRSILILAIPPQVRLLTVSLWALA